jgi:hypothetical protein
MGQFQTLAAALEAAGLVSTLKGAGPFTVFAPTDEAFAQLPAGTVESLLEPDNGGYTDSSRQVQPSVALSSYHPTGVKDREVGMEQSIKLGRRQLLFGGSASLACGLAKPGILRASTRPVFTYGVQSGDVDATGGMVWTRVDRPARVFMEYDTTGRFTDPVRVPMLDALPEGDLVVKRLLDRLPPDQEVFYRFQASLRFPQRASGRCWPSRDWRTKDERRTCPAAGLGARVPGDRTAVRLKLCPLLVPAQRQRAEALQPLGGEPHPLGAAEDGLDQIQHQGAVLPAPLCCAA